MNRTLFRFSTILTKRNLSTFPEFKVLTRPIEKTGSRKSRKLRNEEGFIPGVLYGIDENMNAVKILVMMNKKETMSVIRKLGGRWECTVLEVKVDETQSYHATMRQAQVNSLTGDLFSVNFLIYRPGNRIKIPVSFLNEDLNEEMKKGACLIPVHTMIECTCQKEIPEQFLVDVAVTPKKGIVRIDKIRFPEGVKPIARLEKDLVLALIREPRGSI